jgi:hypothetical protein
MKRHAKTTIILASAAILLSGLLSETARAQGAISGTSTLPPFLTPVGGTPAQIAAEYLTVNWSVTPIGSQFFYTYTINNPSLDVLMINNNNGTGTLEEGDTELVDSFQVSFNASAVGAVTQGPYGGPYASADADGVNWVLGAVLPGSSSPTLSFFSNDAPTFGNAQAEDNSPPSPWASINNGGQTVPIPNTITTVPEPATMTLFSLTGLLLLPFRSTLRQIIQKKETSSR